jgi:hypothetical protein
MLLTQRPVICLDERCLVTEKVHSMSGAFGASLIALVACRYVALAGTSVADTLFRPELCSARRLDTDYGCERSMPQGFRADRRSDSRYECHLEQLLDVR